MSSQKPPSWSEIKAGLKRLDEKEMVQIIRDLYHLSRENKVFLASRFGIGNQDSLLEPYKRAIRREFNPDRGFPKLNLTAARKAVADFKKADSRPESVIELLVYYVEEGVACTLQYGDINEQFYSSLESAFEEAIDLIVKSDISHLIERFRPRLQAIVSDTVHIGWGFHDHLEEVFYNEYPGEDDQ